MANATSSIASTALARPSHPLGLVGALFAAIALTACGGATPPAEVASPGSAPYAHKGNSANGDIDYAPASVAGEVSSSAGAPSPTQPQSESAYGQTTSGRYEAEDAPSAGAASEGPAPWRRPGLATQWGEARDSQVREVSFFRQNPGAPAATLRVQYDDETGIAAATGRGERDSYPAVYPLHGGDLVIRVEDSSGDPLPSLQAGGRNYVIGEEGDRYQIRVDNNTPGRFEIVASVDGLDVLDGSEANFSKRGYLVNPWSSVTIEGFRDSYETVRAFRFGDVGTSYAAQRGKARNVGVIGVAAFEEQGFYWTRSPGEQWRRDSADPFPGRFAPAP